MEQVKLLRYSDPDRTSLAHNGAIFLGKPDTDNIRRPLNMLKMGHTSIFRGESVKFEFNTSKVVYDHLTTYTTAQVRACAGLRANEATEFVPPVEVIGTPMEWKINEAGFEALKRYNELINGIDYQTQNTEEKVRLQAARAVAPMSVRLKYVLQFNFLTLMEAIFPQRIWEPGAQPDTRIVVQQMFTHVRECDPKLWDLVKELYGPEAISWKKAQTRIKKDDPELYTKIMDKYGQMKSMWT